MAIAPLRAWIFSQEALRCRWQEAKYNPLITRLRDLRCPVVAAVNGPCAGVGMSFAMVADIIIANESAFFLQAFRNIGLVPDGGATYMLPRLVVRLPPPSPLPPLLCPQLPPGGASFIHAEL